MSGHSRAHSGPPASMVFTVAAAATVVVLLAYGELAFEVARRGKPWGPFMVRCVVMGVFWAAMMRAYLHASRVAIRQRRWWLYLLCLAVLLGSMAVAVVYRLFVNVQSW